LRIGILGGAFNPPHLGHLICAQEAHRQLGLDVVVLIPVGEAPHRTIDQDPGAEMRFRLCERAVAGDARLSLSRLEIDRGGRSFTVETLRVLRERAGADERVLVMGGDQAATLPEWRDPRAVLELACVAVADRGDLSRRRVEDAVASVGADSKLRFFDMPRIDISSTLVRGRAAAGESIRYLVPDPVADFIAEHDLYKAAAPVGAE